MILEVNPKDLGERIRGCVLITGFQGIGATGYWAVKHLIQKLEAKRIGVVDSPLIAPLTTTYQGELVTPYEFYRSGDLVFFKVEASPQRGFETRFFRALADWIVGSGLKEAALIGGLDSSLKLDESNFRWVATSAYKPAGILKEGPALEDDHIIVGPVAILLNRFQVKGFPAFAVLPYASSERVDPRAAATAVSLLGRHYGFDVDVSALIKGAEALEMEFSKEESRFRRTGEHIYT